MSYEHKNLHMFCVLYLVYLSNIILRNDCQNKVCENHFLLKWVMVSCSWGCVASLSTKILPNHLAPFHFLPLIPARTQLHEDWALSVFSSLCLARRSIYFYMLSMGEVKKYKIILAYKEFIIRLLTLCLEFKLN